jgi:hypothetical protein
MEPTPAGKKLKESDSKSVIGALSYFSLNDVKKQSSFKPDQLNFDHTFVCELKNSTLYTFDIAKSDDKTYVKCRAECTADLNRVLESKEGLKDKEAKLLARDKAAAFTDKHKDWVYELADYKAGNLTKKPADLLEDIQQKKPGGEPNAVAPANGQSPSVQTEPNLPQNKPVLSEPNAAAAMPMGPPSAPTAQPAPADSNNGMKTKQPQQ